MNRDFGAFELREELGSGTMGTVYRAVQKSLRREVVLKILHPHLAKDSSLVSRFTREALGPAALHHENIVQVIDAGRRGDEWYIAMEFVEGMNLRDWVNQHGTPPPEIAVLLLRDLCDGLAHAHGHGLIHRDIKPANLMFTPGGVLKIADFGLARLLDSTTEMTVPGSVLGTASYMSPEQADGRNVDGRSDVFSAGVVGYELFGGKRPFEAETLSGMLRAILTVEPPPLDEINPQVPRPVAGIVGRMLEKELAKRYQSSEDVLRDVELAIEQLGISRGRALLRDYAGDPAGVRQSLERRRVAGEAAGAKDGGTPLLPSDTPAGEPRPLAGPAPPLPARDDGARTRAMVWGAGGLLALTLIALLVWAGLRAFGPPAPGGQRRSARVSAPPVRRAPGPGSGGRMALLRIESIPTGAQVLIDGALQPLPTNAVFRSVPPGVHVVEVSKDGYQALAASVAFVAGRDTAVTFRLAPGAGGGPGSAGLEQSQPPNAFEWSIETVDMADDPGRFSSLAMDAQDQPHVCYFAAGGRVPMHDGVGTIRHATRVDGVWSVETITGAGNAGESISLAMDGAGQPHVSFIGPDNRRMCYAARHRSRWDQLEAVEVGGNVGRWSSLAIDGRGRPCVSYYDESNGALKYAQALGGGRWATTIADPTRGAGQHTSLRIDAAGRPCISYYHAGSGHLKLAFQANGRWSTETVDPRGRTGWFSSLALDANGNPRISYYDLGRGDLRYAEKDAGGWRCGPVDTLGNAGQYTSIALDHKGHPYISYCGGRNSQLKLAVWDGSQWIIDVVDRTALCQWSSLALDSEDQPHITYYDLTRRELRIAEGTSAMMRSTDAEPAPSP